MLVLKTSVGGLTSVTCVLLTYVLGYIIKNRINSNINNMLVITTHKTYAKGKIIQCPSKGWTTISVHI